jgi:hypothetical protein
MQRLYWAITALCVALLTCPAGAQPRPDPMPQGTSAPALGSDTNTGPGSGQNEEARLILPSRRDGARGPIPELVFSRQPPKVRIAFSWDARNGITVTASLRGRFKKKGYSLLAGPDFTRVKRDRDGVFTIEADIKSRQTRYTFAMVDPAGNLVQEWIIIEVPRYDLFVQTGQKNPRKLFINAGLGFTSVAYQETNISGPQTFSSIVATPKISAILIMPSPVWSLGFTAYVTALQLKSSLNATARFLGLNARAGYRVPFLPEPWQLTLMAGYYYTTMFVTPATFGYRHVGGPQLFPTVKRAFKTGDFASAYFKYSPIANGVSLLGPSNREIGAGFSYTFAGRRANPLAAYLDFSQFKLDLPLQEFDMSMSTVTFGASYGF